MGLSTKITGFIPAPSPKGLGLPDLPGKSSNDLLKNIDETTDSLITGDNCVSQSGLVKLEDGHPSHNEVLVLQPLNALLKLALTADVFSKAFLNGDLAGKIGASFGLDNFKSSVRKKWFGSNIEPGMSISNADPDCLYNRWMKCACWFQTYIAWNDAKDTSNKYEGTGEAGTTTGEIAGDSIGSLIDTIAGKEVGTVLTVDTITTENQFEDSGYKFDGNKYSASAADISNYIQIITYGHGSSCGGEMYVSDGTSIGRNLTDDEIRRLLAPSREEAKGNTLPILMTTNELKDLVNLAETDEMMIATFCMICTKIINKKILGAGKSVASVEAVKTGLTNSFTTVGDMLECTVTNKLPSIF